MVPAARKETSNPIRIFLSGTMDGALRSVVWGQRLALRRRCYSKWARCRRDATSICVTDIMEATRMASMKYPQLHPELFQCVKNEVPKEIHRPKRFEAFMFYSDTPDTAEAKRRLQYGGPPWVYVTHDWTIIGFREAGVTDFTEPLHRDRVFINSLYVAQYELIKAIGSTPEIQNHEGRRHDYEEVAKSAGELIRTTVVHEIVHWGDNQHEGKHRKKVWDDKLQKEVILDAGDLYETAAFGRKISQDLFDGTFDGWFGCDGVGWYNPLANVADTSPYLNPLELGPDLAMVMEKQRKRKGLR